MFKAELEIRKRRRGILGYDDLLSRLADALDADDCAGSGADASAVADRVGRRVPGHRPGAVEGDRPRLHRPLDADPDRRPQAGHLRVPRRGHRHVPDAAETAGVQKTLGTNWRSDGALGTIGCRRCSRAPNSGIRESSSTRSTRTMPVPVCAARRPATRSGFAWCAGRRWAAAGLGALLIGDLRSHIPADVAADIGELVDKRRHVRR